MVDADSGRDPDGVGLRVSGLRVDHVASGLPIIEEVEFEVPGGSVFAIVGESGGGKSTVAMAALGYARPGARLAEGEVRVGGLDIVQLSNQARRRARGEMLSYVGQDPGTSLNPAIRIGRQITELLETHRISHADAQVKVREYLDRIALPTDREFLRRYPHELSGGQIQRVLLAMALAADPTLVVLDEPTTSLDVSVQRQVLEIVDDLRTNHQASIVYVSHDLAVVSTIADHVAVMYGGRIVEHAPASELFRNPQHPYTVQLLGAIPRITADPTPLVDIPGTAVGILDRPPGCPFAPRCSVKVVECDALMPKETEVTPGHRVRCFQAGRYAADTGERAPGHGVRNVGMRNVAGKPELVRVADLCAWFGAKSDGLRSAKAINGDPHHRVLHDVTLSVLVNECLGIVGESGSGKTTLARCIVGLHTRRSGQVALDREELDRSARERNRSQQSDIQIVFQNPNASLNPRQSIMGNLDHVIERLGGISSRRERQRHAEELLSLVGLRRAALDCFPRELSGGEKQRVAIARALAPKPRLLLCDEITSALDVSVQATIIELIQELRRQREDMAIMFISHDLAVVNAIADRVIVMRGGRIVEEGLPADVLFAPQAQYTRELIDAVPRMK